ncbi:MAG TPA: hypothetical protein VFP59_09245 [Candidatus Angelobacter sp.]|nr:hypothetical protein [Candidatus Angelobacter sp.]
MPLLPIVLFMFLQHTAVHHAPAPKQEIVDLTPAKTATEGPFGFEPGMKKEAVIAELGPKSVDKNDGDVVIFNTAPKPHPDFDEYIVVFSPSSGLVKLNAVSRAIDTNESGDQVKAKFQEIKAALAGRYGKPADFDQLSPGSMWNLDKYWMMSLLKKDRKLKSFWIDKPFSHLPNGIKAIMLDAQAFRTDEAYLDLTYEFSGFSAYADSLKAKQNSVF